MISMQIALATSGAVRCGSCQYDERGGDSHAVKEWQGIAVSQKDLFEAVELVLVGKEKKDRILSAEERQIVSVS